VFTFDNEYAQAWNSGSFRALSVTIFYVIQKDYNNNFRKI